MYAGNPSTETTNDVQNILQEIREINTENGRSLVGTNRTHGHFDNKKTIKFPGVRKIIPSLSLADQFNNEKGIEIVEQLLTNIERLYDINGEDFPEEHRIKISNRLIEELSTNAQTFSSRKNASLNSLKLFIPLTIYHGTSFCSAIDEKEFESLRYPYGVDNKQGRGHDILYPFYVAAVNRPLNPRKYLRSRMKLIEELKQNPKYANLLDYPTHFIRAAFYDPNDFDEYLDEMSNKLADTPLTETIEAEEETEDNIIRDIMEITKDLEPEDLQSMTNITPHYIPDF
jgi:hypothetical protein